MGVTYRYMGISHSLGADRERSFFLYQAPKVLEGNKY